MREENKSDGNTSRSATLTGQTLVNAWVFAGGEFQTNCFNSDWIAAGDVVVGVDHGIAHCLNAGAVPDVMLGDFDSVDDAVLLDDRLAGVQRLRYPSRKNSSDLELALEWLSQAQVARVILMGVSGGRSDHHLINWLLASQERWPFAIEMIDSTVHAHVVTPRYELDVSAKIGQTVSLMPLFEASGVTTVGLEYALHEAHLVPGTTRGLSNVAAADIIRVSITAGRLLVFRVNADSMVTQ